MNSNPSLRSFWKNMKNFKHSMWNNRGLELIEISKSAKANFLVIIYIFFMLSNIYEGRFKSKVILFTKPVKK